MTALSRGSIQSIPQSNSQSSCVCCVYTVLQPTDCLPYNQCCAACKQTVQGLSFWSDRAVFEKVQSSSEHTTSSLKILAWKWQGLLAREVKGVTERLVTQLPHASSFTYLRPIHNDHIWLLFHRARFHHRAKLDKTKLRPLMLYFK